MVRAMHQETRVPAILRKATTVEVEEATSPTPDTKRMNGRREHKEKEEKGREGIERK
jgi:hypothetical protein